MGAKSLEQRIAAMKTAKSAELAAALRSGTGVLVAAAAKRVVDERLDDLVPDLVAGFAKLPDAKKDPACRGKVAIARALHDLDRWEPDVFVAGLTIVQREGWAGPGGGPPDDTAAELRGVCGIAHAHFVRPDALDVLADLLVDPERTTRVAAATGLGDSGRRDATALLRFKVRIGDADGDVIAACLESLLALARDAAIPFLLRLLDDHDERAECAALALGGGRVTDAYDALVAWSNACRPPQRQRVAYVALALLRHEPATAYLLGAVRDRAKGDADAAARALATFRDVPAIGDALRAAMATRTDLDPLT